MADVGSWLARWSKLTVAKAMRPSLEIASDPAGLKGLITLLTCGTLATCRSIGEICARTPGASTRPEVARNTIWSVSPAWAGNSRSSRSSARWVSVPGSEKLVACLVPTACAPNDTAISRTTQETTTIRRCRIVHAATRAMTPALAGACGGEDIRDQGTQAEPPAMAAERSRLSFE